MSKPATTTKKPMPTTKMQQDFIEGKSRDAKAARNTSVHGNRVFFAPEGYRRLTINLPEALHKKLKMAAVEQECTATEIIERLLTKELG